MVYVAPPSYLLFLIIVLTPNFYIEDQMKNALILSSSFFLFFKWKNVCIFWKVTFAL